MVQTSEMASTTAVQKWDRFVLKVSESEDNANVFLSLCHCLVGATGVRKLANLRINGCCYSLP